MAWLSNSKLFTVPVGPRFGSQLCTAILDDRLTVLHKLPLNTAKTWVPAMRMVLGIETSHARLHVWPAQSGGASLSWLSILGAVVRSQIGLERAWQVQCSLQREACVLFDRHIVLLDSECAQQHVAISSVWQCWRQIVWSPASSHVLVFSEHGPT